jgi:predicted dinucleotide-binding enzyme
MRWASSGEQMGGRTIADTSVSSYLCAVLPHAVVVRAAHAVAFEHLKRDGSPI